MARSGSWMVFFAALAVACGNTREELPASEDGGNGGTAGRGPVAPPAQASLFFVIGPPGVPGAGCAISGAYVASIGGPPTSSTGDPGPREVDGEADARIGCRVSGSSTFELSASAEKFAAAFVLLGGAVSASQSGSATIGVAGPGTAGKMLTSEDSGCQLSVERPPFQVAPGNIWASFNCPVVTNVSDPGSRCSARGEFVFENCEQQ